MSLHSKRLSINAAPPDKKTEQRPRILHLPNSRPDETSRSSVVLFDGTRRRTMHNAGDSDAESPYMRPHGNSKPQEVSFASTFPKGAPKRLVQHPHDKPWSGSTAPGKKENVALSNPYHRVWCSDDGGRGRWNRELKREHYEAQDKALFRLKPHDEKHAVGMNFKRWTHVDVGGTKRGDLRNGGGKFDYNPPRPTFGSDFKEQAGGLHLKSGFYKGKFENVKHVQKIINTGKKTAEGLPDEFAIDDRPMFDNRLFDDMERRNFEEQQWALHASMDLYRPANTRSCPMLGADFTWR